MPRKFKVAKLEDVPEADRPLYVKKGDAFILDVEGAVDAEEIARLEGSRSQFQRENARLAGLLKRIEDAGIDPKDDDAIEAFIKAREKELSKQTEVDKLAATVKTLEKSVRSLTEERDHYRSDVHRLTVHQEAGDELAKQKGSVRVLMPHIERQTRVIEVDGRREVEVLDNFGKPRTGEKGERFTVSALIAEMKADPDFAHNFEGVNANGGGAPPGGAGGNNRSGLPDMTGWTPEAKLAWAHKNPELAARNAAASKT